MCEHVDCVDAAGKGVFDSKSQFDTQLQAVSSSLLSSPLPLAAHAQIQCLVCLRLMVQKVLQELKLYHG